MGIAMKGEAKSYGLRSIVVVWILLSLAGAIVLEVPGYDAVLIHLCVLVSVQVLAAVWAVGVFDRRGA